MSQIKISDLNSINFNLNPEQTKSIMGGIVITSFEQYKSICPGLMTLGPTSLACGDFVARNADAKRAIDELKSKMR